MYTASTVGLCFLGLLCVAYAANSGPQNGTVTLARPNDNTNGPFSSGIVRVYYNGEWQSICSNTNFGLDEADVICHQLGYASAVSYSTANNQNLGTVNNPVVMSEIDCSSNDYQVLFQCSYTHGDEECDASSAITVDCSSTRIWDDPFNGQLRLTGGSFSNDGVVEVYCNNEWGTVCSDSSFGDSEAEVICGQLGYNDFAYYNSRSRNSTSVPVWLNNVDCSSSYSCLSSCETCPFSDLSVSCTSNEIVNVVCSYDDSMSDNTQTVGRCDFTDIAEAIGRLIGIIVGVIIAVIVCTVVVALLPFCICCCLGVGVCAAASKA